MATGFLSGCARAVHTILTGTSVRPEMPAPARSEQMMERNPDFAQLLNNPQLLRESLQVASNPVRARRQLLTLPLTRNLPRLCHPLVQPCMLRVATHSILWVLTWRCLVVAIQPTKPHMEFIRT